MHFSLNETIRQIDAAHTMCVCVRDSITVENEKLIYMQNLNEVVYWMWANNPKRMTTKEPYEPFF